MINDDLQQGMKSLISPLQHAQEHILGGVSGQYRPMQVPLQVLCRSSNAPA